VTNSENSDIKPENILFHSIPMKPSKVPKKTHPGEENKRDEGDFVPGIGSGGIGAVKLADFGFSKMILGNLTATPCGTMGYAAPEIVDDQKYSTGVDMWALGCVLFALLAGYPPFYDPNIKLLMKRVSKGEFAFDSPWWDNISKDAKDLIRNLLTVDPTKRYTINEFMAHPWIRKGSEECSQQNSNQTGEQPKEKQPSHSDSHLSVKARSSKVQNTVSEQKRNEELLSPAHLALQGQVECRTPDVMNVGEIFDVAFSVHQIEEERRRQERIFGKISSTNSATTAMSQLALSGAKGANRLSFMVEPSLPDQASGNTELKLDNSSLLEKRRTRQQGK
jgi:serine/threonine protein kinase